MLKACCWVRVSFHHHLSATLALQVLFSSLLVSTPVQGQGLDCNYAEPKICGNISIPYPFGMSPECGLPDYRISCKPNASYGAGDLPFLQLGNLSTPELQVLEFTTNTLVVNSTDFKAMPADCNEHWDTYGLAALELPMNGPFVFATSNVFVVIGCNADGMCNASRTTEDFNPISIACTTSCYNQFNMPFCNYYACCINALPPGSRSLILQGRGIYYREFPNVCGFTTVLDPASFKPTERGIFAAGHYGLSLSWALKSDQNCSIMKQSTDYACHEKATCLDDGNIKGYTCNCTEGYRGDGYKAGIGCQDIDECEDETDECENPPLGTCVNTDGSYVCRCTSGEGSGLPGTCPVPKNVLLPALLGGLGGAALLGLGFLFFYLSRRAYRRRKDRENNFKRIGGDQLISFLFSESELTKATKGFADDHVLGEGGFGKVYWGKLSKEQGGMKVAIKRAKTKAVEEQVAQIQSFVREILLLGKCAHKNVVRLLGCCVETAVPLLVYEYVERGTLRDYLRPQSMDAYYEGRVVRPGTSLLWAWRLHIAVETAEAVGYLHNMSEPVFHLDMKSPNILIDSHYNPKVADFGLSCFLTSDATHITNQLPVGTFGYVDPEYYHSLHVTDKCDVYSFGVILLELISGLQASQGPGAVLAHQFRTEVNMREEVAKQVKEVPGFIDTRLGTDRDVLGSIQSVAELARRCVALKGADRPSMQEVVKELRQIEAKNSGRPYVEGPMPNHDHRVGVQELYDNVNSNESDQAAFLNYKGIPSDHSSSSSSLFTPPQLHSGRSSASSGPQFTAIELRQLSRRR